MLKVRQKAKNCNQVGVCGAEPHKEKFGQAIFLPFSAPAPSYRPGNGDFCLKASEKINYIGSTTVVMTCSKHPGSSPNSKIQPSYDILKFDFFLLLRAAARSDETRGAMFDARTRVFDRGLLIQACPALPCTVWVQA